ncbi:thymidylate kinase [Sulfurihydrogenibium azorense Az-Fu1]|uniref:Thymidylate kinase n=1 Tax=Sulfurihydrogenibium azorense (strain DSM 15241 / OCM 825 / Az-Fu1) TaxID=204536 RepID=C1DT15_SULAA|nr:dTMP kinase [Sulfurihydrogenibium azorense]ACN98450.1 thymidylate kinase [Sulfurihydrogenibium azorense Az-Fu1]
MGVFITFEGIEGSGKSTQAKRLYEYLTNIGIKAYLTREPGGTSIGKKIREILLSHWEENFPSIAELLLYQADRNIHVNNIIKPLLQQDYIVISDRFYDSTTAYQHYARGIDYSIVDYLNKLATEGIKPHITFLLDLPVQEAFKRLNREKDRLESEGLNFHQKVREGFLKIADMEKDRVIVLDGLKSPDEIFNQILNILKERKIL